MEDSSLIGMLFAWFPTLLLIVVSIFFMQGRGLSWGRHGMPQAKYLKDHLEETRRLNKNLERIAHALEERADNSC
ncbi:MAG: hypothetical protein V3S74_05845 [Alphaproteobacteria bacterium]|nr:hypothetical protein [Alphaproteobacteria bacterium]